VSLTPPIENVLSVAEQPGSHWSFVHFPVTAGRLSGVPTLLSTVRTRAYGRGLRPRFAVAGFARYCGLGSGQDSNPAGARCRLSAKSTSARNAVVPIDNAPSNFKGPMQARSRDQPRDPRHDSGLPPKRLPRKYLPGAGLYTTNDLKTWEGVRNLRRTRLRRSRGPTLLIQPARKYDCWPVGEAVSMRFTPRTAAASAADAGCGISHAVAGRI